METLIHLFGEQGTLILVVVLLLALLLLVLGGKKRELTIDEMDWPYIPRELMTAPERILFGRLRQALPDYLIFTQVQLSRMLDVDVEVDYHGWINRINRMSVDFVVCAPDGATILAAIELDDSTHNRADRIKADAKKDRALAEAGIRLIRWPVHDMPQPDRIRREFLQGFSKRR